MSTGAFVARYSDVRKSSAMPLANLPMMLAVAGATMSRSMLDASEMCSISAFAPGLELARQHAMPRDRFEGELADELARGTRHDGDHVVPLLLEAAHDLDRFVGADSAAHADSNHCHGYLNGRAEALRYR